MLTKERIDYVRGCVYSVAKTDLPWDVQVKENPNGLTVRFDETEAEITADGINSLARGFFLLSQAAKENKQHGYIAQQRHFDSCGAMVDVSRNAVMKVEAVKRYINQLACLGMNMLMLYTEDTFEVPEYPTLGYLRGGYTMEEIREIDDYAASLGVELVPCIQTLAHLAQFLQWESVSHLSDTHDVLLIDEPETYTFIEAEIRSISSCVRTKRIHIGMDEAHGVGLGKYYAKNGPKDRFDLLNRHLVRVVDICKKYGLAPIMWSDMFFRLGSKTNAYCDKEAVIPQKVIDNMPDVALCYWDYYHTDEDIYEYMLTRHAQLCKETVFAGGVWTWSGFLPQVKRTEASMSVGLKVCAKHKVNTVIATMWGDDGAETNTMLASSMLPIFSEACWQGPDYDMKDAIALGECLTGIPRKVLDAWGDFYPGQYDSRPGKQLIWGDPLYPLTKVAAEDSFDKIIERSETAIETMRDYQDMLECQYATLVFKVCMEKAKMAKDIRSRYLAGDKPWLSYLAQQTIPTLLQTYKQLELNHRKLWERDNRRFGWEVICLRYGGAISRLVDVQDEILRYLSGELTCIEELDVEPRDLYKGKNHHLYGKFVTPAKDYWQLL